jgi:hypothetical protein
MTLAAHPSIIQNYLVGYKKERGVIQGNFGSFADLPV